LKYKKKLFFIERWNWKKIIKQKEQKNNQKNKDQNWSNNKNKFLIESWNWKKNQFNKKLKKNNQMNEDHIRKSNIWQIGIEE